MILNATSDTFPLGRLQILFCTAAGFGQIYNATKTCLYPVQPRAFYQKCSRPDWLHRSIHLPTIHIYICILDFLLARVHIVISSKLSRPVYPKESKTYKSKITKLGGNWHIQSSGEGVKLLMEGPLVKWAPCKNEN